MSEEDPTVSHLSEDDYTNPAFAGAYRKGALARRDGKGKAACPYDRDQYGRQGVTFARAFWKRWMEGWEAEDRLIRNSDAEVRDGV
ncbi:hypothetical protein [Haloglomus halophilum]|uniref:hypothetical protein n=1 Tax=Haloglomus halophilum TaxID=2962672 RepID=UPI0020C99670|nr:hypothetical protein [Haloglomus halophilum]